ncbi:zeta toxin family protein [Candidatus Saccharibacteria bacterium]|nr:zeta toxin family protein [Candidatus Saccharibacteria bacterium]
MDQELQIIIKYMKSHWPSQVEEKWQIPLEAYPKIAQKIVALWAENASLGHELVRVAGLSGSGKTTQLLPAVNAYFEKQQRRPILVAARRFVEFHPFTKEIETAYGSENLRKMTDEFSTIMMFFVLYALITKGYDIILDVTLLDPKIEGALMQLLNANQYKTWFTMIAVSPAITEKFLGKRAWRHAKATEEEFIRATNLALNFYQSRFPSLRIILWNVWDEAPIYDGEFENALKIYNQYSVIESYTKKASTDALVQAKIDYLLSHHDL